MWQATTTHIVFGVYLEEPDVGFGRKNGFDVLRFQADASFLRDW